jgi:DNA polymerase-3 subunit alpha
LIFIKDTLALVNSTRKRDIFKKFGKPLDEPTIDSNLNDPEIYKSLRAGKGALIFQFESPLMRKLLKDADCDSFDCLAAITALGRPGPLQSKMTEEYCQRKMGVKNYTIHPVLKEILGYTYGIVVYQEQIMQIANILAGFTLAETDTFRKVLIKIKKDTKDDMFYKLMKYKEMFLKGGQKYMKLEELEELFDGFLKWSSYGFNKSHAVAYTIISYRCAWLKTYFPQEYICVVLRNIAKGETKLKGKATNKYGIYAAEAMNLGIDILPPHINHSKENFVIEGKNIRIGFGNIKNIGTEPASQFVQNQPYKSYDDFIEKNPKISKRAVERAILAGAFDEFGERFEMLLRFYKLKKVKLESEIKRIEKDESPATVYLVNLFRKIIDKTGGIEKLTDDEKDMFFADEFGFSLNHPIKKMKIDNDIVSRISEINTEGCGGTIALIKSVQVRRNSKDSGNYIIATLEDGIGNDDSIQATMHDWDKQFNDYKEILKKGSILYCNVTLDPKYNRASFNNDIVGTKVIKTDDDLKYVYERIKAAKTIREKYLNRFLNRVKGASSMYKSINEAKKKAAQLNAGDEDQFAIYGFFKSSKECNKTYRIEICDDTDSLSGLMFKDAAKEFIADVKPDDFVKINFVVTKKYGETRSMYSIKNYIKYNTTLQTIKDDE